MTAAAQRPGTLPGLLAERAAAHGEAPAWREKEFGLWQSATWGEVFVRARDFGLGLLELGLQAGEVVAIVGDNRPEWVLAEWATQGVGGIALGLYQDSVAEEIRDLLAFADARIVVAEDQEQVDKLLDVWDQLEGLQAVIYHDPKGMRGYDHPKLHTFEAVEAMGQGRHRHDPDEHTRHLDALDGDSIALFATTSGTTGRPKLAMLSHRNMISAGRALLEVDPMGPDDELLSFLPLAWIGEQMLSVVCGLLTGLSINFPEEPETVQLDLREIGPHVLFSPPRIWENMVSEVQVKIEDASWLGRRLHRWSMAVADTASERGDDAGAWLRVQRSVAEWTCLYWIKDQLGLTRLRRAYTGGAALGPDVFRFFRALGINFKQIYGQTEVSGISVAHRDEAIKFQTVGHPLPSFEVRIADDGEILLRSPSVFEGYFENPEATAETLRDGWLHSGDAGYFDDDGHLVVIDRAKDVMRLADGTVFSPQLLENKLKFSPYVREAVVFGGDGPWVAAMVVIDAANTGKWAERRHLAYTTFTDLAQKDDVLDLVAEQVDAVNRDVPPIARIRRFLLLHKELDADDAELTRTRKVRRRFIAERYRELVDALYGEDEGVDIVSTITYQDGHTADIRTQLRIVTVEA